MSQAPEEIAEYPNPDGELRDGIREDDNPIPTWFWATFLGTVVFAACYLPYYLFSGWSQAGQYQVEVEAARAQSAAIERERPSENPYRGDPAAIAAGAEVWAQICLACHKPDGSGLVGPSLVDPYWKYGNSDATLFETVSKGRPGGMPPWGPMLGDEKIWKVLAYLETLPRSDEPGMGAPGYVPPAGPGS